MAIAQLSPNPRFPRMRMQSVAANDNMVKQSSDLLVTNMNQFKEFLTKLNIDLSKTHKSSQELVRDVAQLNTQLSRNASDVVRQFTYLRKDIEASRNDFLTRLAAINFGGGGEAEQPEERILVSKEGKVANTSGLFIPPIPPPRNKGGGNKGKGGGKTQTPQTPKGKPGTTTPRTTTPRTENLKRTIQQTRRTPSGEPRVRLNIQQPPRIDPKNIVSSLEKQFGSKPTVKLPAPPPPERIVPTRQAPTIPEGVRPAPGVAPAAQTTVRPALTGFGAKVGKYAFGAGKTLAGGAAGLAKGAVMPSSLFLMGVEMYGRKVLQNKYANELKPGTEQKVNKAVAETLPQSGGKMQNPYKEGVKRLAIAREIMKANAYTPDEIAANRADEYDDAAEGRDMRVAEVLANERQRQLDLMEEIRQRQEAAYYASQASGPSWFSRLFGRRQNTVDYGPAVSYYGGEEGDGTDADIKYVSTAAAPPPQPNLNRESTDTFLGNMSMTPSSFTLPAIDGGTINNATNIGGGDGSQEDHNALVREIGLCGNESFQYASAGRIMGKSGANRTNRFA